MTLSNSIGCFINKIHDQPQCIFELAPKIYDKNAVIHGPLKKGSGLGDIIEDWDQWVGSFDQQQSTFELMESTRAVVATWRMQGVHVRPFGDVPPTGKEVNCSGMSCYRFNAAGVVISHDYQADLLGMYKQMGYRPSAPTNQDYEQLLTVLMRMGKDKPLITKREVTNLAFYLQGRTAKDIALWFKVSYRTVQTHLSSAMHKIGCNSKSQAFELVESLGLTYVFREFYDLLSSQISK